MNLFKIVQKNLAKRLLSTTLTVVSVALAVSLVIAVQVAEKETERSFNQTSIGFDLILASPGSRMQATLNTIYHLETSTGIIPASIYQTLLNDPRVDKVFPFYVGDSYRGRRVIGTSAHFLKEAEPRAGERFNVREGRIFEAPFEVVLGHETAERLNLSIGDSIVFTHGVAELGPGAEPHVHDDAPSVVVGILNPTATAHDRVLFTSIYSTHAVHDHQHEHGNGHHHDHDGDDHNHHHGHSHSHEHNGHQPPLEELEKRVTELDAVLVKFNNQALALQVAGMLNFPVPENPLLLRNLQRDPLFQYKDDLMGVIPAVQIQELMSIVGNAEQVLRIIAILVFIVALTGILVSIYNTMEERRRDIAIMRSLGAKRFTILNLILLEAAFITLLGCLIGLLGGHIIVSLASTHIAQTAGIVIQAFNVDVTQLLSIGLFVLLGILAGLIPALKAYNTDVVTNLAT